jgi:hypothetical protein
VISFQKINAIEIKPTGEDDNEPEVRAVDQRSAESDFEGSVVIGKEDNLSSSEPKKNCRMSSSDTYQSQNESHGSPSHETVGHLEVIVIFETQIGVGKGNDADEEDRDAVSDYERRNSDCLNGC